MFNQINTFFVSRLLLNIKNILIIPNFWPAVYNINKVWNKRHCKSQNKACEGNKVKGADNSLFVHLGYKLRSPSWLPLPCRGPRTPLSRAGSLWAAHKCPAGWVSRPRAPAGSGPGPSAPWTAAAQSSAGFLLPSGGWNLHVHAQDMHFTMVEKYSPKKLHHIFLGFHVISTLTGHFIRYTCSIAW